MEEVFRSDLEIYYIYNVGRFVFYIDFSDMWYCVKGVLDGLWFFGVLCLFWGYVVIMVIVGILCYVCVVEYIDVFLLFYIGWLEGLKFY